MKRVNLGRATTTRSTVTRRGFAVTDFRATRPPHRNHPTPSKTPPPIFLSIYSMKYELDFDLHHVVGNFGEAVDDKATVCFTNLATWQASKMRQLSPCCVGTLFVIVVRSLNMKPTGNSFLGPIPRWG
ncbi:hypothetical protein Y032_0190g1231 [Ancylostoma ceylanicum]|uniref:Uncharacterized protein n=1 Tax=Ancylostoma ceylanicum TaxID=53326 RepID=A0A016SQ44_9BILA|nr:hypothetical protein Y032_0190g1231 [Ancylostoma ceylanicum]